MRLKARIVLGIFIVCALAAFPALTRAQGGYTSQLRGIVTDPSGGVMANAIVTITEAGTNASRVAHTDTAGVFNFTGLRPSAYSVKVEAKGFRPEEKTNVVL